MAALSHRTLLTLPTTTLPWLSLRDHFIATVGPHSGQGQPLGPLLVLADATFAPHSRFALHRHQDIEILSVVIEGALSHHGDQEQGAILGPRTAQLISARDGIVHAEGNDTDTSTRMLQIWFRPQVIGGPPAYFRRDLDGRGRLCVAGDAAMPLRAAAQVWWQDFHVGREERFVVAPGRRGYLLALDTPLRVVEAEDGGSCEMAAGEGLEVAPGTVRVGATQEGAALWVDVG